MAAEIPDIAEAIADRLNLQITGMRAYAYVPDTVASPMATIWPVSVDYHMSSVGDTGTLVTFRLELLVGRVSERSSQERLQAYLSYSGDDSIRAALESDETLGGTVQQLWVRSADNVGAVTAENVSYLAVDFTCEVMA